MFGLFLTISQSVRAKKNRLRYSRERAVKSLLDTYHHPQGRQHRAAHPGGVVVDELLLEVVQDQRDQALVGELVRVPKLDLTPT